MSRLQKLYKDTILPELEKKLGTKNIHQVPKLTKIVISMGVGEAINDKALIQTSAAELGLISGQKPLLIKAKKSVSNFKLREGMEIGCKVTLRGTRMFDFLERLISTTLPRVRDFRGVSDKAFDGRGNYSLGIDDQMIFNELNPDKVKRTQGMNIAFVTTAKNDDDGRLLLAEFGMPFKK